MAGTIESQRKQIATALEDLQTPPRNVSGDSVKAALETLWGSIVALSPYVSEAERDGWIERFDALDNSYSLSRVFDGHVNRCPLPVPVSAIEMNDLDDIRLLLDELEGDIAIAKLYGKVDIAALENTCNNLRRELREAFGMR